MIPEEVAAIQLSAELKLRAAANPSQPPSQILRTELADVSVWVVESTV